VLVFSWGGRTVIKIIEWATIGIARRVLAAFACAALFVAGASQARVLVEAVPGADPQSAYPGAFFAVTPPLVKEPF
jgi:hypothetical protein